VRRFIMSSVIAGSSVALECRNPILPGNPPMTVARYSLLGGALTKLMPSYTT
jgi:hypothetical protein